MATFCYTGVAVQKRLVVTSISSRTGCCLYRLPQQCSDCGGKSVIMQRVDSKIICTNKRCDRDVGHQMATVCCTGVAVHKRLAVTSISSRTGCCLYRLLRQRSDWGGKICHHAEVDSKNICTNKRCDRDVGHQMATFCNTGLAVQKRLAVTSVSNRTGCCLYRLSHQRSDWCGTICHDAEGRLKNHLYKRCDREVGHQMATLCCTGAAVQKRLVVTSISSRTGCCLYRLPQQYSDWDGKSIIMQRVESKIICTSPRCDRGVGHQMATFCYIGVAVQKRPAVTSVNSRTGCCLYRLAHQYSDWGGKSVIMQKSTQKNLSRRKM